MRMLLPAAFTAALLASAGLAHASPQVPAPAPAADASHAQAGDARALATQLLDRLDAGDFTAVQASFTDEMRQQVPTAQLQEVWASLPQQLGAPTGRGESQVGQHQQYQVVVTPLQYERGVVMAQTAIDEQGRIAGFLLQPAPEAATPPPTP